MSCSCERFLGDDCPDCNLEPLSVSQEAEGRRWTSRYPPSTHPNRWELWWCVTCDEPLTEDPCGHCGSSATVTKVCPVSVVEELQQTLITVEAKLLRHGTQFSLDLARDVKAALASPSSVPSVVEELRERQLTAEDAQRILDAWRPVYDEPVVLKLKALASSSSVAGPGGTE